MVLVAVAVVTVGVVVVCLGLQRRRAAVGEEEHGAHEPRGLVHAPREAQRPAQRSGGGRDARARAGGVSASSPARRARQWRGVGAGTTCSTLVAAAVSVPKRSIGRYVNFPITQCVLYYSVFTTVLVYIVFFTTVLVYIVFFTTVSLLQY